MATANVLGYTDSLGNFQSLCSSAGVAISADLTLNPTNLALEATLQSVLAKIIAAPATSAKQDTAQTSLTAIATALGTPADAAWTTGSGSVIAILKAIAANTAA